MKTLFTLRKASFFVLLILWWASCGNSDRSSSNSAAELTPLEAGKKIYRQHCIQCHGYDGTLQASGSANLKTSQLTSEERITFIKKGKGAMMPYEKILKEKDLLLVSDYVGTIKE